MPDPVMGDETPRGKVVLVCGGRDYADESHMYRVLDQFHRQHGVRGLINGGARGADAIASRWAFSRQVPQWVFTAEWKRYAIPGRKNPAGPIRNKRMLDEGKPDVVLAFDGGSGTADMVRQSVLAGVEVIRA